jgi:hypothetical protein
MPPVEIHHLLYKIIDRITIVYYYYLLIANLPTSFRILQPNLRNGSVDPVNVCTN